MARLLNSWTMLAPIAAAAMLALTAALGEQTWLLVGCGAAIIAAVLAAVHHAEVIAHRVGEPFGTLVLALSVTVIEAALLLSLLVAGGTGMETLPRDTRQRSGASSSSSRPSGTATTFCRTTTTPLPTSMLRHRRAGRRC
jgi:hypothetical protein